MANKVGNLIKQARTDAGLTQEALAKKVAGLSASDLGKAERGEKALETEQLKQIAKITGVTQKSLVEAAASSKYTSSSKQTSAKSTSKSSSSKTSTSKTSSGTSMKVTATEKKLVELYRAADADKRKEALKVLKGEQLDANDILTTILNTASGILGGKQ